MITSPTDGSLREVAEGLLATGVADKLEVEAVGVARAVSVAAVEPDPELLLLPPQPASAQVSTTTAPNAR